jgi:hypothetical protein
MTIANQVQATVVYAVESTFGTAPSAGTGSAKTLRRVTTSLAGNKDTYQSAEARPDLQIADMRHGTKRPGGGIEAELSNVAFDDFLEALLRGTWTSGISTLAATYTTIAAAVTTGVALQPGSIGTLTWAASDPVAQGYRLGDIVRLVGAGFAPNNAVNFRIVQFGGGSNRTISVTPAPAAVAATAGTSIGVVGKKLAVGTVARSFTMEQSYPDIDVTELFTGMRVGSGAIRMPPNGMCTISLGFMGQAFSVLDAANAPYFTAPAGQATNGLFSGPSGALRVGGVEQGVITGLDINIDLGLDAPAVVGSVLVPDIFYSQFRLSGNVSFFLQDKTLINQFVNENEIDIVSYMPVAMTAPEDFLTFNMQRVKLGGATKTIGASSGVIVSCPFSALLANATGADASTLIIQRSN